jgi:hypothetical protein
MERGWGGGIGSGGAPIWGPRGVCDCPFPLPHDPDSVRVHGFWVVVFTIFFPAYPCWVQRESRD